MAHEQYCKRVRNYLEGTYDKFSPITMNYFEKGTISWRKDGEFFTTDDLPETRERMERIQRENVAMKERMERRQKQDAELMERLNEKRKLAQEYEEKEVKRTKTPYIWSIEQDVNNDYDTYSSAVVIAYSAEEAKRIHPAASSSPEKEWYETYSKMEREMKWYESYFHHRGPCPAWYLPDHPDWVHPIFVKATEISAYAPRNGVEAHAIGSVLSASFHAG